MNRLTAKNVTKEYPGGVRALRNINLEIENGEMLILLGPSGSGKTTLINILGLIDRPTEGSVYLDGKEINSLKESEKCEIINSKFGFIFQFFYLIPELTIVENVMLPLWIKEKTSLKLKVYHEEAEKLLKEFGLSGRKNFYPSMLSGGELQRAAICRSLICKPSIVFADEPTGSIDKKSSEVFFNLIKALNEKTGVTFIIGTHNEKFLQFATKVVYLNEGEIEKIK
jgi:ABC-type lipoprotein export system ATPase subunit